MQVCSVEKYGAPEEVINVHKVPIPASLKSDEVLVKIHYAALNAGDYHIVRGTPFLIRVMFGLKRPKISALGSDFAGVIVQTGEDSSSWQVGDRVFGDLSDIGCGAISEYQVIKTKCLVKVDSEDDGEIKEAISLRDVCTLPVAGSTALGALETAEVQPGERVLVIGASGGVGHFAVQIAAKVMRAEAVVGVCSTKNVEMVKECGATSVIDYTAEKDFLHTRKGAFDVILDCANDRTATNDTKLALECLKNNGRYVFIGGKDVFRNMFCQGCYSKQAGSGKRATAHIAMADPENNEKLLGMLKEGKIKPYVGSTFSLKDAIKGMVIMDSGRARGKIVIEVSQQGQ